MLIHENLIAQVKTHLKLQAFTGNVPFRMITGKKGELTLGAANKQRLQYEYVKTKLYYMFAACLWLQLFYGLGKERVIVSVQSFLYVTAGSVYPFTKWIFLQRRDWFIELFNLMTKFEKTDLKGKQQF